VGYRDPFDEERSVDASDDPVPVDDEGILVCVCRD